MIPGPSAGDIADLMLKHPRRKGEDLTDWFERVFAAALGESRRPYREPGEDDE